MRRKIRRGNLQPPNEQPRTPSRREVRQVSRPQLPTHQFNSLDSKTTKVTVDPNIVNQPSPIHRARRLRPLIEVEEHISESKHLPNIPSIDDIDGWKQLSVGDRDMKLLEKVEELTLYVIDLQKQINKLKE